MQMAVTHPTVRGKMSIAGNSKVLPRTAPALDGGDFKKSARLQHPAAQNVPPDAAIPQKPVRS
jgi:hypothetical protein